MTDTATITPSPVAATLPLAGRYHADPSHSSVLFRINHLALSWYTGRFTRLSATLDLDPDHPELSRLDAQVELGSVRMEYAGTDKDWDAELSQSEQFMDGARNPLARFRSTSLVLTGEAAADVVGTMTFRGVERPFTFQTTYNGVFAERGGTLIGFSAKGILKRSDYGLVFGLGPRMPDAVEIIVETEMHLEQAAAPTSPPPPEPAA